MTITDLKRLAVVVLVVGVEMLLLGALFLTGGCVRDAEERCRDQGGIYQPWFGSFTCAAGVPAQCTRPPGFCLIPTPPTPSAEAR